MEAVAGADVRGPDGRDRRRRPTRCCSATTSSPPHSGRLTVVLLMATVGPAAVVSLAQRLAAFDVELVDAPVSGGTTRAAAGDLLMMVSGSERALAAVRPLLDAMASSAPVVGTHVGDGQKVKLVNQLLCGVHIAAAGEALAFAEALGLDPKQTWEVLRSGAAASFMFDDRGSRMVATRRTPRCAAPWTFSSRTWAWWSTRRGRAPTRRRSRPRPNSFTSAAGARAWAGATTPR